MRLFLEGIKVEHGTVSSRQLFDKSHQYCLRNHLNSRSVGFLVVFGNFLQRCRLTDYITLRRYCKAVLTITRSIQARNEPSPRQVNLSKELNIFIKPS